MAFKVQGGEDNPLVQCINPKIDKWMVMWDKTPEEENFSYAGELFYHKPSLSEIKEAVYNWYNSKVSEEILSGFSWKDISVWLSMENQFNYKTAYDLAIQTNGEVLPTFKLGTTENPVYYKFNSLEDLQDFYTKMATFVQTTLSEGWSKKDSVDWEVYSELLNKEA
jgi:hypothetical protein